VAVDNSYLTDAIYFAIYVDSLAGAPFVEDRNRVSYQELN
jgi:hypothetical protein